MPTATFVVLNAYIRKEESSKINHEKEEKFKPNPSRIKEIKIGMVNRNSFEMVDRKTREKCAWKSKSVLWKYQHIWPTSI